MGEARINTRNWFILKRKLKNETKWLDESVGRVEEGKNILELINTICEVIVGHCEVKLTKNGKRNSKASNEAKAKAKKWFQNQLAFVDQLVKFDSFYDFQLSCYLFSSSTHDFRNIPLFVISKNKKRQGHSPPSNQLRPRTQHNKTTANHIQIHTQIRTDTHKSRRTNEAIHSTKCDHTPQQQWWE